MRKVVYNIAKNILLERKYIWAIRQMYKWLAIKLSSSFNTFALTGPVMGSIIITYRCNSRCSMCDLWQRVNPDKKKELTTQESCRLIDEFARLGTTGIGFSGGEPLLREDIFELIQYVRKKGMIVTISTNGLLLSNKKIAQKLIDSLPYNINISLDSFEESNFDRLRGTENGLSTTLEGIRNVVAYKKEKKLLRPTITIVTVLNAQNINSLDEIISVCENLKVDSIGFIPIQNTLSDDGAGSWQTLSLKERNSEIKKVTEKLIALRKENKSIKIDNSERYIRMFPLAFEGGSSPVRCIAGYGSLFVDTYGDVYPCQHWMEKKIAVANIQNRTLMDIWKSKEYRTLRRKLQRCRDCFWNCQTELSLMFD